MPRWIGLPLLLPVFAAWVYWLVVPSVRTALAAVTGRAPRIVDVGPRVDPHPFIGTGDALGRSLLLAVVPVLVMAIVVPLLSWAATEGGTPLRLAVRLVLTVPVAGFAPAIVAVAWSRAVSPDMPLEVLRPVADGAATRTALLNGLAGLGLVCGIGVAALLAALRRRRSDRPGRTIATALTAWAVAVLGTLAVALQSTTLVLNLTNGGPGRRTTTLTLLEMRSFQTLSLASGAAAGTVLLVVVGALGLGAALLLVLTRSRVEVARERPVAGLLTTSRRATGATLGVLALVVALGILTVTLLPRVGLLTGQGPAPRFDHPLAGDVARTLLAAALTVLVQVPVAYLGGLGIGAFRPVGRHSEWLLLPFGPWLFVTVAPIMTVAFTDTAAHHHIDTLPGLVSPILVSVPALFLFALFGRGHRPRWQAAREARAPMPFVKAVLLPSLPLLALVTVVAFLVQAHDLLWPMLVTRRPSAPVLLAQLTQNFVYHGAPPPLSLLAAAAPFGAVALLALLVLQAVFMDRLSFRTGPAHEDDPAGRASGATAPVTAARTGDPTRQPGGVAPGRSGPVVGGPTGTMPGHTPGPGQPPGAGMSGPSLGGLPPSTRPPGPPAGA